jgi:hypothetical protein
MCCTINIDLATIKDILLIIGSSTTILFAFLGYNKWKKELKGRVKFELTRTLLKEIYSFRDAFKSLRSTFIFASEFPNGHDPSNYNKQETNRHIFSNRLKYFNESYNSILSLLPEVELEFEKDLFDLVRDLLNQIMQYHMKLNEFIQLTDHGGNDDYYQELRKVIYDIGENNPTTIKFMSTIDKIETKLKKEKKKY